MELSQTIWPPDAVIRQLRPSDRTKFADHLLRLDAAARHDRFNGGLGDAFLRAYAERSFAQGSTVVGFVVDGEVHGAAEIHEQAGEAEPTAEIAFSVEPAYQHIGVGTLLFDRLLAHARAMGYSRLRVTTHAGNHVMRRLARKFGASLTFGPGETAGVIHLAPLPPLGVSSGPDESPFGPQLPI